MKHSHVMHCHATPLLPHCNPRIQKPNNSAEDFGRRNGGGGGGLCLVTICNVAIAVEEKCGPIFSGKRAGGLDKGFDPIPGMLSCQKEL